MTTNIPKPLEKYAEALKAYEKKCIEILPIPVTKRDCFDDPLELQQSKFGGKPFFPKAKEYPKDSDGYPMILIAQINYAEVPNIDGFPEKGLLQFYSSLYTDIKDGGYKLLYITPEEMKEEALTDFSFVYTEDREKEIDDTLYMAGLDRVCALAFTKKTDRTGFQDRRFDFLFDGNDMLELINDYDTYEEDERMAMLEYLDLNVCKMNGYAHTDRECEVFYSKVRPKNENDIQLLQMAYGEHINLDTAINFFISPNDLKNKRFNKAYLA